MNISGIASYGQSRNVYLYSNNHYNQTYDQAVNPVQKVYPVTRLKSDDDELNSKESLGSKESLENKASSRAITNQENVILQSYGQAQQASYDLSNPYETERMSQENVLLSGMNVDLLA